MGSTLLAVHRGGRRRRLVVVIRFVVVRCCRRPLLSVVGCCSSFAAARRPFLSVARCYMVLRRWPCVCEVDGGGLALVGVQSWTVVGVDCFRGRWLSFVGCCVLCASLLPLLGGRGVVFGGCCRSWTAGTV